MLTLTPEAWRLIASEAERLYPDECCGLLLGRESGEARIAHTAYPATNRHGAGPAARFLIPPEDFMKAEKEALAQGALVLGVYHSHPDVAARPSIYDIDGAWPWYSYLIVALAGGRLAEARCFRLGETRAKFNEEPLEWLDEKGAHVHPDLDSDAAAGLRGPTGER